MTAKATDPSSNSPPSSVSDEGPAPAPHAARVASAPRKRKGPKPRHVPQRTCIVTRQTGDKRGLVRLVRTTEGRVEVDPTGKKNGRGAYLTADRAIWEQALARNVLARALKTEISPEDVAALRAHAATLPTHENAPGDATPFVAPPLFVHTENSHEDVGEKEI